VDALRDQIAIAAMAIFLDRALQIEDGYAPAVVAARAYQLADAMLTERGTQPIRTIDGRCVNGFKTHRWDLETLTCFRCHIAATKDARHRWIRLVHPRTVKKLTREA